MSSPSPGTTETTTSSYPNDDPNGVLSRAASYTDLPRQSSRIRSPSPPANLLRPRRAHLGRVADERNRGRWKGHSAPNLPSLEAQGRQVANRRLAFHPLLLGRSEGSRLAGCRNQVPRDKGTRACGSALEKPVDVRTNSQPGTETVGLVISISIPGHREEGKAKVGRAISDPARTTDGWDGLGLVTALAQANHSIQTTPASNGCRGGSSLRHRSSFEKFTASLSVSTPVLPPMPKGAAATAASFSQNAHSANDHSPRKKDELWGIFRGLEADFQKFQSKTSSLKANVIRSSLLPFLGRHHLHASCKNLRPEDLDRRVNILNRWWIGMLEMLNGKNNQSISGTDRAVFLEAVVGIMTRPEWRIPFPTAQQDGGPTDSLKYASTSVSETSEGSGSSGSDFLVESIHHNIRNIFVQNLISQMAFVVERMSMRNAPASLVVFCGKACAYAFFFCPGVADILVRLWNTPPTMFRRIFAESAESRAGNMRAYTHELALSFPASLRPLGFHSHAPLLRYLRQKPDAPLNTTNIPWQGPWIARWCGRDKDLFFVFVKFIHILYAEYLPAETPKAKRILAPGLLLIHAQLLVALEDTIYKQSSHQPEPYTAASITFDDLIESPDASASSHPLGAGRNSHRSMAENRLIMILRDLLSESSSEPNRARLLYAETFCGLLKVAAQRISLFDHNACFLLCDFVEEVIPIITRYAHSIETELFDWGFWLEVCRQMMQSHNSLTEVRVFSFIYCLWGTWTSTEKRKAELCLDFLLHERVFYYYFNHWSPMVRAYFHRVLCWRVGRFNGDPSPFDSIIYETLSDRLLRVWEYYIGFQSKAEEGLTAPLSSAPCTPAPGRRIIIIRCDNQLSPTDLFVSFDRVIPPTPPDQVRSHRRSSSSDSTNSDGQPSKRRWGLLRAMFGTSSAKSGDSAGADSSSDESDSATTDLIVTPATRCLDDHEPTPNNSSDDLVRPKTPHQPFFFKFSLEWMDRPQWPTKNKRLFTPCLPVASQLHVQHRRSPTKSTEFDDASETIDESDNTGHRNGPDDSRAATDPAPEALSENQTRHPTSKDSPLPELPYKTSHSHLVASKYAGRALAEWAHIVSECDSFFARRRDEGVPTDRMVETPTLGVESFRK
ncbi:hypothetical protein N7462_009583 [Penicillium macrosclerotiorum]|uniref:uncharacterized protein n=1 Tax=Penicillium macrosclerotiorum TaxID=303699 RepID=UPI0025496E66|nr:uncharacterized protein N7462_009583 [Penicillium macrosclerotiorum]KAJ5674144.1 hypothetical protein N7462_009583 [Penicillium macrosclerotiorum]